MKTRIREIRESRRLTQRDLAARIGVGWQTVQRQETKGSGLTLEKLRRYADALDVSVDDLLAETNYRHSAAPRSNLLPFPANVPLMGVAAGAAVEKASLIINQSAPVAWVQRPPGIALDDKVYALHVINESMVPRYFDGELVYVSPARAARPGDHVVILIENYRGAAQEAYIKKLVRLTDDWVVAKQYYPPATVEYKRATVTAVHRILTLNELFGL